jgi:hypothetical protein
MPASADTGAEFDRPERTSDELSAERQRTRAVVAQLTVTIDDARTALGLAMRLTIRRGELQAYLQGLEFALGISGELTLQEAGYLIANPPQLSFAEVTDRAPLSICRGLPQITRVTSHETKEGSDA